MKLIIYCYFIWIGIMACQRKTTSKTLTASSGILACIQQKIDSISQQPVWNPPAEIHEYLYADKKVYVISARCCDFYSVAVDSNCNYICAPSGGFTGKGDRRCSDFAQKAKQLRLIWKDERERK